MNFFQFAVVILHNEQSTSIENIWPKQIKSYQSETKNILAVIQERRATEMYKTNQITREKDKVTFIVQ